MTFDLNTLGNNVTESIKRAVWFPYSQGNLKFNATQGRMYEPNVYRIHFDSIIAPYIDFLEFGTQAHNIPGAFGKLLPFGTSGRFSGFFHPGSTKHKGFIGERSVNYILDYIKANYKGVER
jgi:hypothetical protein